MPIFFLCIIVVYLLINLWIVRWFWKALFGFGPVRLLVALFLCILTVLYPVSFFNRGVSPLEIAMVRLGSFWLGVFFYTFLLVILADLVSLPGRWLMFGKRGGPRLGMALIVLLISLGLGLAGWVNAAWPELNEVNITLKTDVPRNDLTLALISDVHLGRVITANRLQRALSLLIPCQPDALLFAGDILDDHLLLDTETIRASLAQLAPRLGTWGIVGNHEYISGPIETSLAILESLGIHVLRDNWAAPGGEILLVGRDDYSRPRFGNGERLPLNDLLGNIPDQARALPSILLDHQPRQLEEAEAAGMDLQLSGHTHNAQLWPFNLLIKILYENGAGLSQRGQTQYFVSVGVGTWGPPIRNNASPEVVLLRVHFAASLP